MISLLQGTIYDVRGNLMTILVGGVGYQVHVSPYTVGKLIDTKEVTLFIYTHVREDALQLYGFLELAEKEMFELLISISGIGPKVGLSILAIADPKTIRTAIVNRDPSILTSVSGVGKKTAERVIIELQNKVDEIDIHDSSEALADQEAIEALMALGYSVAQARDALKAVPSDVTDMSTRIRLALKSLGK
jgi:Holliday junction DNA helicase RuvA